MTFSFDEMCTLAFGRDCLCEEGFPDDRSMFRNSIYVRTFEECSIGKTESLNAQFLNYQLPFRTAVDKRGSWRRQFALDQALCRLMYKITNDIFFMFPKSLKVYNNNFTATATVIYVVYDGSNLAGVR